MSHQMNLPNLPNVISLPELESGHTLCDKRDGLTTDQSGQAPALANLSARQAKAAGLMTSGTYGQRSTISSASADLASYLESRLRARTDLLGSTLYKLTWKERATPSGRLIPALRASVRRTSDSDYTGWVTPLGRDWKDTGGDIRLRADGSERFDQLPRQVNLTGWPTPVAQPANGTPEQFLERKRKAVASGSSMGICLSDLQMVAQMVGWPTPRAQESNESLETQQAREAKGTKASKNMDSLAQLASWPTPRAIDGEKGSRSQEGVQAEMERKGRLDELPSLASLAGWPTPQCMDTLPPRDPHTFDDWNNNRDGRQNRTNASNLRQNVIQNLGDWSGHSPARLTVSGELLTGSSAGTISGGQLNPAHSRWLMGLPPEWDACAVTAIPLSRRKLKRL